jgi:hypothetical protein
VGLGQITRISRGDRTEAYANGLITGRVLGPLILSFGVKVLIVVICALISVIVAMVAGFLSRSSPGSPAGHAVLYGGGAFAGCLLLCLAVLSSLGVL